MWMLSMPPTEPTTSQIEELAKILRMAGLQRNAGDALEIHPALTGYLKSLFTSSMLVSELNAWRRAFVDVSRRYRR